MAHNERAPGAASGREVSDQLRSALASHHEGAKLGEEAQSEQLYQLKSDLDASGVYIQEEIERTSLRAVKTSAR